MKPSEAGFPTGQATADLRTKKAELLESSLSLSTNQSFVELALLVTPTLSIVMRKNGKRTGNRTETFSASLSARRGRNGSPGITSESSNASGKKTEE